MGWNFEMVLQPSYNFNSNQVPCIPPKKTQTQTQSALHLHLINAYQINEDIMDRVKHNFLIKSTLFFYALHKGEGLPM